MSGTAINLDIADGTATITLDGPATRNALDAAAATDLIGACDRVDADNSVGVVVLTGAHGAFCSGAHTAVLTRLRSALPHEAYVGLGGLYAAFRRVGSLAVPSVAVVDGPAVGAGVNLALAVDLRIVTHDAVFVSGFARIGLHPGGGHLHLLTRAAGVRAAMEAGVFAQTITAPRAVAIGLAADEVATADVGVTVARVSEHLAADPALARALVETLRRTVHDPSAWDRAAAIERARQMWSLSRPHPHTRRHPAKES